MQFDQLGRREFIAILGGATAWPLSARAQQNGAMRRIGVLMAFGKDDPGGQARAAAFEEGLQKLGWTQGRNIRIDTRWATADVASIQRSAKELVASRPDLILSHNTPTTTALVQQTRTIPTFSRSFPIQSVAGLSRVSRGRVATSPVLPTLNQRCRASGWSCSRRLHRTSTGSPFCSTRQRRPMQTII